MMIYEFIYIPLHSNKLIHYDYIERTRSNPDFEIHYKRGV